jgi:hypothetical protein
MVQPLLPHHVPTPTVDRYLEDLHTSSAASAPFANRSEEDVRLIVKAQLRKADEARRNVSSFFEFVFREETTRTRLKTLPFQRVIFKFIRHYRFCILRLPTGYGKTYTMAADGLYITGRDCTQRGTFLSNSESQAQKPLLAMRSYIEQSPELRVVFPKLMQSQQEGDPWTQSAITVQRPFGIRFPTASAVGLDSQSIIGTRLSWLNIDDVLDEENTHTKEQRDKVTKFIKSSGLSRLDPHNSRCAFTQTPWHPEDSTFALESIGWPSLNMDCWGGIWFENADDFDCDDIRPSRSAAEEEAETGKPVTHCRLVAHDGPAYVQHAIPRSVDNSKVLPMESQLSIEGWKGDDEERVPLWPERWGIPILIEKRGVMGGGSEWARTMEIKTIADDERRIKDEWIEAAKANARKAEFGSHVRPPSTWDLGNAFTGVDLGFGKNRKSGNVSVFSIAILPTMHRLLLAVDVFKYPGGKQTLAAIRNHHDRFSSRVAIESNAAQRLLKEWALAEDVTMRVTSFETNKNKNDPSFGVESIFLEFENGVWLIPSGPKGQVDKHVLHWLEDLKSYRRGQHTGDALMANWIARERARLDGALVKGAGFWGQGGGLGGINTR